MKPISASIILLWICLPWVPVVVYDIATENSIEGANIGVGMLGMLAVLISIVGIAVYLARRSP